MWWLWESFVGGGTMNLFFYVADGILKFIGFTFISMIPTIISVFLKKEDGDGLGLLGYWILKKLRWKGD